MLGKTRLMEQSDTVKNRSGNIICMTVVHGCGIGCAKYKDCERKSEFVPCLINKMFKEIALKEMKDLANLISPSRAFQALIS